MPELNNLIITFQTTREPDAHEDMLNPSQQTVKETTQAQDAIDEIKEFALTVIARYREKNSNLFARIDEGEEISYSWTKEAK